MAVARNISTVLYASAARTVSPTAVAQSNVSCRGVVVFIDVTAVTASPSVVFTIQGRGDDDEWYDILASAAVTATGNTVLRVYPGLTASANAVANDVLPGTWRVSAVHGDADSITYKVTAHTIV